MQQIPVNSDMFGTDCAASNSTVDYLFTDFGTLHTCTSYAFGACWKCTALALVALNEWFARMKKKVQGHSLKKKNKQKQYKCLRALRKCL